MHSAPFGHTSLSNDFKLNNSILIGITKETSFSIENFLNQFGDAKNINFEAILIDSVKPLNTISETDFESELFQVEPDQELDEKLNDISTIFSDNELKFDVCSPEKNDPDYLKDRSILYDLFCVGEEMLADENRIMFDLLCSMKCPIMVIPNGFVSPEHMLFLFDGTPESILGVKKFIKMFSDNIRDTTVTAMILNDFVNKGFNEKIIVDFLLSNFIDVGVVFTTENDLERDTNRLIKNYPHSIILSGLRGAKSVVSQNVCKLICKDDIPLYFF